jgi:hypothetical protein
VSVLLSNPACGGLQARVDFDVSLILNLNFRRISLLITGVQDPVSGMASTVTVRIFAARINPFYAALMSPALTSVISPIK